MEKDVIKSLIEQATEVTDLQQPSFLSRLFKGGVPLGTDSSMERVLSTLLTQPEGKVLADRFKGVGNPDKIAEAMRYTLYHLGTPSPLTPITAVRYINSKGESTRGLLGKLFKNPDALHGITPTLVTPMNKELRGYLYKVIDDYEKHAVDMASKSKRNKLLLGAAAAVAALGGAYGLYSHLNNKVEPPKSTFSIGDLLDADIVPTSIPGNELPITMSSGIVPDAVVNRPRRGLGVNAVPQGLGLGVGLGQATGIGRGRAGLVPRNRALLTALVGTDAIPGAATMSDEELFQRIQTSGILNDIPIETIVEVAKTLPAYQGMNDEQIEATLPFGG